MTRIRIVASILAGLFLMCPAAMAQASPRAFLESIDGKLKPLLANSSKNEKRILNTVNRLVDFDTLCRKSLGKHWNTRSESERNEFKETLHALIEKNMVNRLEDSRDHVVTYEGETVEGDRAEVVTTVADGTGPRAVKTEIAYEMRKNGQRWKVVDMVTDGVSLVQNYRSQFNKIIVEEGWDALMQKMRDKLAEADGDG